MSELFGNIIGKNGSDSNPKADSDNLHEKVNTGSLNKRDFGSDKTQSFGQSNEYLRNFEIYQESTEQEPELQAQVQKCTENRQLCYEKEQQVEKEVQANAANTKRNYKDTIDQYEESLTTQIKKNTENLNENYAREKELVNEQKYYQNTSFGEHVYSDEIQNNLSQLYNEGDMTKWQQEYMDKTPKDVCGPDIKNGPDLVKQEEDFSNTDLCKTIVDPSLAKSPVVNRVCFWILVGYPVLYTLLSLMGWEEGPIFGAYVFALGLCIAGAETVNIIRRIVSNYNVIFIIAAVVVFIGVFIWSYLIGEPYNIVYIWNHSNASVISFILLVISDAIGTYAVYEILAFVKRFLDAPDYAAMFNGADKDEQIAREMYCYLNHDSVLAYLNGPSRKRILDDININLKNIKNQRNKLMEEKSSIEEEKTRLSEMKEQADDQINQINQNLKEDFPSFGTITADDTKDSALRTARKQYEQAKDDLETAQTNLANDEDMIRKSNTFLISCTERPVLNNSDPAFQKEIAVRQGEDGNSRVFILNHGLQSVDIQFQAENPDKDICTLLKYIMDGFEKMNAPELLQIHVVDEKNGGQWLLNDADFLAKVHLIEDKAEEFEIGSYIYGGGRDLEGLNDYLDEGLDAIRKYRKDFVRQVSKIDVSQHQQDEVIYGVNKLRLNPDGGSPLKPFTYKVLLILVPERTDDYVDQGKRDEMTKLLDKITNPAYCQNGIIPFFFSNVDNINHKYEPYVNNCDRHYITDLNQNKMCGVKG